MIQLINIRLSRHIDGHIRAIFHRLSAVFPFGSRTAIIGAPGSGKSTLARMVLGIDRPDRGLILNASSIASALGFSSAMNGHLSAAQNIALLCRLNGSDPVSTFAFVSQFADVTRDLDLPLKYTSPAMRARLCHALSLAAPARYYLADEMIGAGDAAFRQKCEAYLAQRPDPAGLLFFTAQAAAAQKFCDRFYALANGRLIDCATADEAQDVAFLACGQPKECMDHD